MHDEISHQAARDPAERDGVVDVLFRGDRASPAQALP
jgi:hypothetical protein